MPLRSSIPSPEQDIQGLIDQYRSQNIDDEQIERRLAEQYAPAAYESILYPEGKKEQKEEDPYNLEERIGERPVAPKEPTDAYLQFSRQFENPVIEPLPTIGTGGGKQYTDRDLENYNSAQKRRVDTWNASIKEINKYNDAVDDYNYREAEWVNAANAIVEIEEDERMREVYAKSIKSDDVPLTFLQVPDRPNNYSWNSALGDVRNTGKFSPFDFGVHEFFSKNRAERREEMLQSETYQSLMDEPFQPESSSPDVAYVSGKIDDLIRIEKQRLPERYRESEVYQQAVAEKQRRTAMWESTYQREWFTDYARKNTFAGLLEGMSPEDLAQAEEDIFNDTGLYINLDGNNVVGVRKERDFWNSIDIGFNQLKSQTDGLLFAGEAIGKKLAAITGADDSTLEKFDQRMHDLMQSREELAASSEKLREASTKYYLTREQYRMLGDNAVDGDDVVDSRFAEVLGGFGFISDSFSKAEVLEAWESAPTSVTSNLVGMGSAYLFKGRGKAPKGAVSNVFNFMARMAPGSGVTMGSLVGGDKFAEIYDDPYFSTFTDSSGKEVSSADASLRLAQAKSEGDGTATYESLGLTRDRNDFRILGYSAWDGGSEMAGELAGGWLFGKLGKYVGGKPLSAVGMKRMKQYLFGMAAAAGVSVPEEYGEEWLTEVLQYAGDVVAAGREFDMREILDLAHEAGLTGARMGPGLSLVGGAGSILQGERLARGDADAFQQYQLRFAFNGVLDRMGTDEKSLLEVRRQRKNAADPTFIRQLDLQEETLLSRLREGQKLRVQKAEDLMNRDIALAQEALALNTQADFLARQIEKAEEEGNTDAADMLKEALIQTVEAKQQLDDRIADVLSDTYNAGPLRDRSGNEAETVGTSRPAKQEEIADAQGLASRARTPEDAASQDAAEAEIDLRAEAELEGDYLQVLADGLGGLVESGAINEKQYQEGVLDLVRAVGTDSQNTIITAFGSNEAFESDPVIKSFMERNPGEAAPDAFIQRRSDGSFNILIKPGSSMGDVQHEFGHALLRNVYDNDASRTALVKKIEKWSNRKGNEVFKAWVDSTKELYSPENQKDQEEELIQNFLQGFVSNEWKVFKDQGNGIKINTSQYDQLVDLFWTYMTQSNPAAKNLNIKSKDGLIAVAKKFEKYMALKPSEETDTQEDVQLVQPTEAAAPEEKVEETKEEKLDPASLFKEQPATPETPAPAEVAETKEEQQEVRIGQVKEATQQAVRKPIEGKRETESQAQYQARLEQEADALLAGAQGVSTPETDALSQETQDTATTPGLAARSRRTDFISGKKVVGVYIMGSGYYSRVFEIVPNDYFHFRNWHNKLTGNGTQPFDKLYYVNEKGESRPLNAPKQKLDKQGNPVTIRPVEIRSLKLRYVTARGMIQDSDTKGIKEMINRKDEIVRIAAENNIPIEDIGLKGKARGSDTYAEIEAAEVRLLAKISETPGAVYDMGDIAVPRREGAALTPRMVEDFRLGREKGFAARSRRKLTPTGVSDNSKAGDNWGFRGEVDMDLAKQHGLVQHIKGGENALGQIRELLGGDPIYVVEVKFDGTDTGTINLEYYNDTGHLQKLELTTPGGINTPIADVFRHMEKNKQVPGPLDIAALTFTGKGQRADMLKAAQAAARLRMPMVAVVKILRPENSYGNRVVFSNAFKIFEEILANSERNKEQFADLIEVMNSALQYEYNIDGPLGRDKEFTSASLYRDISLPKDEDVEALGFKIIKNSDGSTGVIIDESKPKLGFKNFVKYFGKSDADVDVGFYKRNALLSRMYSEGRDKRLSLNDSRFTKLGIPNKEDFLAMHNIASQEEAASKSRKTKTSGDVVGAYILDPENVKPIELNDEHERSYRLGVTGLTNRGDVAPVILFDEFALESEIEDSFKPLSRGEFRKRTGQARGPIDPKVEKTILGTGKIAGTEIAQGKGLEGLASRNRAGRIYHHGANQWEKSRENNFGAALSAVALKLQDKYFDVIMLQSDVENYKGSRVDAGQDFDMALDLMYGKVRSDLDKLEQALDMIKSAMAESGITSDQLSDYLYALHVPERNAYVQQKNGIRNGSGQSNKWANDTIAELESPEMKRIANMVHSIVANTRKTMVDFGLETQETIDTWTGLFENYIPLAGLAEDEMNESNIAYPTGGAGMAVYGTTQKKIIGRKSAVATNVVAQVVMQNAMVHQVARKNEALKYMYNLIKENPNSSVWGINNSKFPLTKLGESGEQESMTVAEMKMSPHTVPLRVDGKTEFLYFRDENYANSLNGMTVERAGIFARGLNHLTGFMRNMLTIYDPNFMISNYARDIQSAIPNAIAEAEREGGYVIGVNKARFTADMMKNIFAATKGLFGNSAFGLDMSQKLEDYKADWEEDGGKTGWGFTKDLGDIIAELEQASKEGTASASREFDIIMGTPKRFANYIEGINEAFEMSIRLAAYITAREQGVSRDRAAQLSKNITVNFNRGGEWQFLNSVYLFFNAAMQGNARFARSMFYMKDVRKENGELESWHKRVSVPQKIAFSMASFSGLVTMLNLAMSGADPDDGQLWYNKIPDFEKERNLIFMHRDGKNYSKLPLPYGYNIFNNLGVAIAETSTGNREMWDGAMFLGMSAFSAFSPIGFGQSKNIATYVGKAVAPTALKPLVEIAANETYFGSQVYRDRLPFATTPYSELAYRSPEEVQEFFRWMNEASGGSKYKSGDYDYNPDMLWYMYEYYIGSAGRFVGNTGELARNMYEMGKNSYRRAAEEGMTFEAFKQLTSGFKGDQRIRLHPNEIPLVRKVYGEPSKYFDHDRFSRNSMEIKQLRKELTEEAVLTPGRYVGVGELYELLKQTNDALAFVRKQRQGARDIEDRTKRINLLYDLDERERRLMTIFNKRYEELRGQ